MIKGVVFAMVLAAVLADSSFSETQPAIRIGNYYAGEVNGISFIRDDAAFLVSIGWVDGDKYLNRYPDLAKVMLRLDMAAPDGSINRIAWKAGRTTIRFDWARSGKDCVIGRVTADGPARIAVETSPSWKTFSSSYSVTDSGIVGTGEVKIGQPPLFGLKTDRKPLAAVCTSDSEGFRALIVSGQSKDEKKGAHAALVFDLSDRQPVRFVAGIGKLPGMASIDGKLDKAEKNYNAKRTTASGDWGDFVEPIIHNLNNSKVYSYESKRIAHVVTRAWCSPDGQVLFEWDSFFNGLLASIDDPDGAKDTVRAILATQQENGLLPSMNGPGSSSIDRSQPPVGAMCVWKMHQRRPDKAFVAEVYPKLVKWHDWWFAPRPSNGLPYRDGNRNGLLEWGSETGGLQEAKWESGLDDSPMYDEARMSKESMMLDDVGLSSLWAVDADYLARIADELGKPADAERFRSEHKAMSDRIDTNMWNEELGIYCNRYWEPMTRFLIITPEFLSTDAGEPGLKAEYFAGKNFDTLKVTKVEKTVDLFWNQMPPDQSLAGGDYSLRWSGKITPTASGAHVFRVVADDAVLLTINGDKVIDESHGRQWGHLESNPVELEGGKSYDIKLEYRQDKDGGECHLQWQGPSVGSKPEVLSWRLSPTNFYPMTAGIPSPERAERMLSMLKDPKKFWGEFVCPSISRDDQAFVREHYWRGKIWAPTNYLMYQGLKRYAPAELRMEFAKKSVDIFMRNWLERGWCSENFWTSGKGGSVPHYTWGSLMCLIGIEEICDIEPDGRVRLNGEWKANLRIDRLPLFGRTYDVRVGNGTAELIRNGKLVMKSTGAAQLSVLAGK